MDFQTNNVYGNKLAKYGIGFVCTERKKGFIHARDIKQIVISRCLNQLSFKNIESRNNDKMD